MFKALESYTRQSCLYGQNDELILNQFMKYADLCSDPLNIFNYMEEKSICIFLGNYWIRRAELFAEMGDFIDACTCLKEAVSRDHIVNENDLQIDKHIKNCRSKITRAIARSVSKSKRSVSEYNATHSTDSDSLEGLKELAEVCQRDYPSVKADTMQQYHLKQQGKPKSWLASQVEQSNKKRCELEERIKPLASYDNFHSHRTPMVKQNLLRLTKTVDSIEMAKKRKSTHTKNKKETSEMESEESDTEEANFRQVHTTPVGRQLTDLKRRVTFSMASIKIEKLRADQEGNTPERQLYEGSQKMGARGSILKKPQQSRHSTSMDQEDMI